MVGARVGVAVVGARVDGARVGLLVGLTVGEKVNCKFRAATENAVKFKTPNPVTGSLEKQKSKSG